MKASPQKRKRENSPAKSGEVYDLHYWPGIPGRGEFVRLVCEVGGIEYTDEKNVDKLMQLKGSANGFAPPFIVRRSDGFTLAQTPVVCYFLAEKCGLLPKGEEERMKAAQWVQTVCDVVNEAHDTHHPIDVSLYYNDQKDEAKKRAHAFVTKRIPAFLGVFASVLKENGGKFLVGSAMTFADLFLFHLLRGLHYAFPKAYARVIFPL